MKKLEVDEEEKKKHDIMKKYYRNRYHSFLKAIMEQNKKREEEMEAVRLKEEKRKAKLKENLGIVNVQSRFMEDPSKKESVEEIIVPPKSIQNVHAK